MLTSSRDAATAMQEFGVKAATDITGFGLLGHAWEVAKASQVTFEIDAAQIPLLPHVLELVAQGMLTRGDRVNRDYIGTDIQISAAVSKEMQSLLYDPQTAGGLLICITEDRANELLEKLREQYLQAAIIGRVVKQKATSLVIQ